MLGGGWRGSTAWVGSTGVTHSVTHTTRERVREDPPLENDYMTLLTPSALWSVLCIALSKPQYNRMLDSIQKCYKVNSVARPFPLLLLLKRSPRRDLVPQSLPPITSRAISAAVTCYTRTRRGHAGFDSTTCYILHIENHEQQKNRRGAATAPVAAREHSPCLWGLPLFHSPRLHIA